MLREGRDQGRKILGRVSVDRPAWKPYEKSMTMNRLVSLISETPGWTLPTLWLIEDKEFFPNRWSRFSALITPGAFGSFSNSSGSVGISALSFKYRFQL